MNSFRSFRLNPTRITAITVLAAASLAGCSSGDKATDSAAKSETKQSAAQPSATPSSSASAPTSSESLSPAASSAASSSDASTSFTMPSERGKVLQAAQDDIQRVSGNPLYISFSDDALGRGRHQILDSNWKVCSQTPAAGTTVTDGTQVRFQTVKLEETCP